MDLRPKADWTSEPTPSPLCTSRPCSPVGVLLVSCEGKGRQLRLEGRGQSSTSRCVRVAIHRYFPDRQLLLTPSGPNGSKSSVSLREPVCIPRCPQSCPSRKWQLRINKAKTEDGSSGKTRSRTNSY